VYELSVEDSFAAAHNLRGYPGECERLHGHNWRVQVRLACEQLNELGLVMDFRQVKTELRAVLEPLDHGYLNEIEPFDRLNPSTENICRYIAERLGPRLPAGVRLTRVSCWESEGCGSSYVP